MHDQWELVCRLDNKLAGPSLKRIRKKRLTRPYLEAYFSAFIGFADVVYIPFAMVMILT